MQATVIKLDPTQRAKEFTPDQQKLLDAVATIFTDMYRLSVNEFSVTDEGEGICTTVDVDNFIVCTVHKRADGYHHNGKLGTAYHKSLAMMLFMILPQWHSDEMVRRYPDCIAIQRAAT